MFEIFKQIKFDSMYALIFIGLILGVMMLTGCAKDFKVEEEGFSPQYACSGDEIHVLVRLTKKADFIEVTDATGAELADLRDEDGIELDIPNIQEEQLPIEIKIRRMGKSWPETRQTLESETEIFDDQNWTGEIEPTVYDSDIRTASELVTGVEEHCDCLQQDDDGECIEEQCREEDGCFELYDFYRSLNGVSWRLPNSSYSSGIRVNGVRNLNDFPIIVETGNEWHRLVSDQEIEVKSVKPSRIKISAKLGEPVEEYCGSVKYPRCCDETSCSGNQQSPSESDYPPPEECFRDVDAIIQLRLKCE